MRKHQQKQILQLIQSIRQAQSAGLYADCQDGAISIGNFIESIEGEGTETVALLEEYCELLFKASNGEIKEKLLRKHLIKIENSVMFELKPNKIEIVFFPYKVSMWDSLESIYLAAKADANCSAYVVPIPSYELNSNGTLGEMHYDGGQYPRDIPVVDWQTYDIEARHPDVAFIHYAYDDNVNNATVHPDFYSKRLREHCELLVYVPYFVASEDTVDEYCGYLPGVLYSHHVIVQSEAVRQSYIGHYKKFDKEFGWKGRFGKAEEKFLALGSPKFDKVLNTRREDCELPSEWEKLIYNPDGSRKKIILYNTHMFTWISGGEAYFKKLQTVFDLFRSRDDVVLWWRPHPNTELNFRTKRPHLLNDYKAVVEGYRREAWGVYDDTPDLHRAIAWSDAYYGDMSSVVQLFKAARKLILLQTIQIFSRNPQYGCPLRVVPLCKTGADLYISDCNTNGIFRYNDLTRETEYISSFPDESILKMNLCHSCINIGNVIYFAPMQSSSIVKLDIVTKNIEKIELERSLFQGKKEGEILSKKELGFRNNGYEFSFISVIPFDDYLIFIPYLYSSIVIYNTVTRELRYCSDWIADITRKIPLTHDGIFRKGAIVGNDLFLPCIRTNLVLRLNLVRFETSLCEIPKKDFEIGSLCFGGKNFFVSDIYGTIYRWDFYSNSFEKIYNDTNSLLEPVWHALNYAEPFLFATSYKRKSVIKIDTTTLSVEKIDIVESEKENGIYLTSGMVSIFERNMYLQAVDDMSIVKYNTSSGNIEHLNIDYPQAFADKLFAEIASDTCPCIVDDTLLSLNDYIRDIDRKMYEYVPISDSKLSGTMILKFIKDKVL